MFRCLHMAWHPLSSLSLSLLPNSLGYNYTKLLFLLLEHSSFKGGHGSYPSLFPPSGPCMVPRTWEVLCKCLLNWTIWIICYQVFPKIYYHLRRSRWSKKSQDIYFLKFLRHKMLLKLKILLCMYIILYHLMIYCYI